MTSSEPSPAHNETYDWVETPAETDLRRTLHETVQMLGSTRTDGESTLSLADTALRDLMPSIPEAATHVRVPGYESHNHAVAMSDVPEVGLSAVLIEKQSYGQDAETREPIEPITLGIGISESSVTPGASIQLVVPSRGNSHVKEYPRTPEETKPPHAIVRVENGQSMQSLLGQARLAADLESAHPSYSPQFLPKILSLTERLLAGLGVDQVSSNEQERRIVEVLLDEDTMRIAEAWTDTYFFER